MRALLLSVAVAAAVALVGCGPAHLSALGNPGDLCTERTACTEGTSCRITELGYRCVLADGSIPDQPSGIPADEAGAEQEPEEESPPAKRR